MQQRILARLTTWITLTALLSPIYAGPSLGLVANGANDGGEGLSVISVNEGGPSHRGGLVAGDRIIGADGYAIRNTTDLGNLMRQKANGDRIVFDVVRNGQRVPVTIVLGEKQTVNDLKNQSGQSGKQVLGVHVLPLDATTRANFGTSAQTGALVDQVYSGSAAEQAGIPVGAVIVGMNGRRVDSPDQLADEFVRVRDSGRAELTYYEKGLIKNAVVNLSSETLPAPAGSSAVPGTLPSTDANPLNSTDPAVLQRAIQQLQQRLNSLPGGGATSSLPTGGSPAVRTNINDIADQLQGAAGNATGASGDVLNQFNTLKTQFNGLDQRLQSLEQRIPASIP